MDVNLINWTTIAISNFVCVLYSFHLSKEEINYKNYKIYVAVFLMSVITIIFEMILPQYLKIVCIIPILFFIAYLLFFKDIYISIASVLVFESMAMLSELIIVILISVFSGDMDVFMEKPNGFVILNLGVVFFLILSLKSLIPFKLYNSFIKIIKNMGKNILITYSVIVIILAATFTAMSYANLPTSVVLILNTILIVLYAVIVIKLAYAKNKVDKLYNKYETSLTSLREYEDIMDKYRVDNHENKNQLLTIRNMIRTNDQSIDKYIDKLVDNKINDNENILHKTSKIPEGGLRATIYSKLCKMNDVGIDYALDISNNVRAADLIKLGDETSLNICKVIGVFLDNAIEAVENLNNKNIILEMFVMDGYMCIDVSNNYEGLIELDKMANKGYTTKGKGHGYGLSLVDEIIKNDFHLENEKKISRDIFTQELKIKM